MSYGFGKRKQFQVVAAVDFQEGKPSLGANKLDCNTTYAANVGVTPLEVDISEVGAQELFEQIAGRCVPHLERGDLTVLTCCPPCTDFSRVKPTNHAVDSPKNSLVGKCADLAEAFLPEIFVLENARELITGKHTQHYLGLLRKLEHLGYDVRGKVYTLTRVGLPQLRQRAIVIASRLGPVKTLDDLWDGWEVDPSAVTVEHAIKGLQAPHAEREEPGDPMHVAPGFRTDAVRRRMEAIPKDGGSWPDLATHPSKEELLIPSMKRRLESGDVGSHCDVYGRLWWNRPALTIKRECAHVGNGRYCHPELDRLLTVREMALLQGFPMEYQFVAQAVSNRYRHVGDAFPPMVSYQLSALVAWMKTGIRPEPKEWVLPATSLSTTDVRPAIVCATVGAKRGMQRT